MGRNKPKRKLHDVGVSQRTTEEKNKDKFAKTKEAAQNLHSVSYSATQNGRISPQISCTVLPEDKQMLNEIAIYAINKVGKPLNTSTIIRALIRLGNKRREELEF